MPDRFIYKAVPYCDKSDKFHAIIGANDNNIDTDIIRKNIKHMVRKFKFTSALAKVKAPMTFYTGSRDLFIVQGQIYALKQIQPNM